ncbi:hypothetical protein, partial [uncultured Allobaculum sp.]|uniref:hypothetical protein n=1 Tax=uncultured Allobaculum sp. TaxID=1187017 RepID=UPI0026EEB062
YNSRVCSPGSLSNCFRRSGHAFFFLSFIFYGLEDDFCGQVLSRIEHVNHPIRTMDSPAEEGAKRAWAFNFFNVWRENFESCKEEWPERIKIYHCSKRLQ